MKKVKLSYETTLLSHLYPYLRRLFCIQRFYVKSLIGKLWNREWIEKLGKVRNVWKEVAVLKRPPFIPSRVWRNICAEAGAILKASYERMILTEKLLENKELIDALAERAARKLKANRFFVENIQKRCCLYTLPISSVYIKVLEESFGYEEIHDPLATVI